MASQLPYNSMKRILILLSLFSCCASCLKSHERVLTSLFEHYHIKNCLMLEEFRFSDANLRMYVKSFSKIKVASAVINLQNFENIVRSSAGTYWNTAVVLYVNNESQIERLVEYFPQRAVVAFEISMTWMVLVAPSVTSFTNYIYVPIYCQFLIIRPAGDAIFNISEFYSVKEVRKESRWGSWSKDTMLSVTVKEPLFRRRRNFNGMTLIAMHNGMYTLQLWYWEILEDYYNFTTRYETMKELNEAGRKADGVILNTGLHRDNYDRQSVFPLGKTQYCLYMKRPAEDSSFWTSYFRPFTDKAWMAVLLFVLLVWFLIPLLKTIVLKTGVQTTREKFDPVGYGCLTVDTLTSQSGIVVPSMTLSFRIAYFATICFAAFLNSLYSGELISYLTTREYPLPFSDVMEFVQDGTYNITFPKHQYTWEILWEGLGPVVGNHVSTHYTQFRGYNEVPRQLCNERTVFAVESRIVNIWPYGWPCDIVKIPRPFHTTYHTMLTSYQFPTAFKFVLPLVYERGLSKRMLLLYHQTTPGDYSNGRITDLTEVDLPRIVPALTILGFGAALAVFVLLLESRLIWYLSSALYLPKDMGNRSTHCRDTNT